VPILGSGQLAHVYLVFGSMASDNTNFNWLQLTPDGRVGDLNTLGNLNQNNPLNGNPGFPFNGVTFIASQQPNSALGASVAGVGNIDGSGFASFMIGAPGADNNNGRAYLIYGTPILATMVNKTVDLDNLGGSPGVNVMTFTNSSSAARTGRSVAAAGPFLNDGFTDILIGAPSATATGNAGQGAVYAVAGNFLRPARTTTVDVSTVGQNGGTPGLILAGANSGDATGRSVSGAGDVDGAVNSVGAVVSDVVIGAPQVGDTGAANGPGKAYLIYGGNALIASQTIQNGVRAVLLANTGTSVPGAVFTGDARGDNTGFAVSTAGDFNGDGLGDFLIGSPGWNALQGRATMIYGVSAASTGGHISGTFSLSSLPSSVPFAELDGQSGDAAAGFSLAAVGPIIASVREEILVGTPGFNGGQGAAFLIPAQTGLFGVNTLSEGAPVFATEITLSQPAATANFLGSGVGGNLFLNSAGRTADTDARSDFIIGSTGFPLSTTNPRTGAGAGWMLEGAFIPLQTPVVSNLTSTIGVDAPFSPPFRVNATTPADLEIFVFSNTASGNPNFVPLRDLDPATVKVNGVAFPNATIVADPVDENNDGLQDAIITINPRSAIGLTTATTTFTLTARTLSSSPNSGKSYSSSTSIIVEGAGPGGGGLPTNRLAAFNLNNLNAAVPPFGSALIPAPQTLSRLTYKPLPVAVAYNQYLPKGGFARRLQNFYHPIHLHPSGSRFDDRGYRTSTLGRDVFTRSRFRPGVFTGVIVHKQQSIPPAPHKP
jgi:hypothetical protein